MKIIEYIEADNKYKCLSCKAHLSAVDSVVSKEFKGSTGVAYLIEDVVNTFDGTSEERELMSGVHVVCDIFCVKCYSYVGWRYLKAYREDQKYKEGKFILERALLSKETS
ncbi:unnamed protein product [Moneuplotes crassus]|uniref:Protein yippee-like n=2 Tax=Euplotes crassus TaxID=5936 RepID=A0AAD2CYK4_EUPCR|nr:unnamed protein product [Moneuplotes crassus]